MHSKCLPSCRYQELLLVLAQGVVPDERDLPSLLQLLLHQPPTAAQAAAQLTLHRSLASSSSSGSGAAASQQPLPQFSPSHSPLHMLVAQRHDAVALRGALRQLQPPQALSLARYLVQVWPPLTPPCPSIGAAVAYPPCPAAGTVAAHPSLPLHRGCGCTPSLTPHRSCGRTLSLASHRSCGCTHSLPLHKSCGRIPSCPSHPLPIPAPATVASVLRQL